MGRARLKSLKDGEEITLDVVELENPDMINDVSDHPLEDGRSVSDHVSLRPNVFPINGVVAGEEAAQKIATLRRWRNERHRLKYTGRNIFKGYVISEFRTEHDVRVRDGFRFRMTLQEVRITSPELVELVTIDPAKVEPTAADPAPSPPPAGDKDTDSDVSPEKDKGTQQFDNSGHPALGERADRAGHPALGRAEEETNRYAGHPALG